MKNIAESARLGGWLMRPKEDKTNNEGPESIRLPVAVIAIMAQATKKTCWRCSTIGVTQNRLQTAMVANR